MKPKTIIKFGIFVLLLALIIGSFWFGLHINQKLPNNGASRALLPDRFDVRTSGWTRWERAWTRTSDATFTVADSDTAQALFKAGNALRYADTEGTWRYGIVSDYSVVAGTSTVTLAGMPLTTAYDTIIDSGDRKTHTLMAIKELYSNREAGFNTDLDYRNIFANWPLAPAYLVSVMAVSIDTDTWNYTGNNSRLPFVENPNGVLTDFQFTTYAENPNPVEVWGNYSVYLNTTSHQVLMTNFTSIGPHTIRFSPAPVPGALYWKYGIMANLDYPYQIDPKIGGALCLTDPLAIAGNGIVGNSGVAVIPENLLIDPGEELSLAFWSLPNYYGVVTSLNLRVTLTFVIP